MTRMASGTATGLTAGPTAGLEGVVASCTPRGDVLRGGLMDKHFAAQLDQVIRRAPGYEAYSDADAFFALTFPTAGLRSLLAGTFARISGSTQTVPNAEHAVYRYETSFGGGKTHGLIALWHLTAGARPANTAEFVDPALLPDPGACRAAAFVGDAGDPVGGLTTDGVTTWTMWGEIARQLGPDAFELVRAGDATRTGCGKQTWLDMFGDRPTVIVIDEIAQYLRRLASSGDDSVRNLADATIDSLKVLFEAATAAPAVRVIVTLATGTAAFGRETADIQAALCDMEFERLLAEAHDVMERPKGAVGRPADDREIGFILRRRLFEHVDETAADAAARAYHHFYTDLDGRGVNAGAATDDPASYAERIREGYPFHPALIDCLDKRIGPIPGFQRARGALKMLAEVTAVLWKDRDRTGENPAGSADSRRPTDSADSGTPAGSADSGTPAGSADSGTPAGSAVLNLGDLPLDVLSVRSCITSSIGRESLDGPAVADFADADASHAAGVDRQRWPRQRLAVRSCRTVFCHSVAGELSPGAGPADIHVGTLRPGDDPDLVDEALAATSRVAWHLVSDGMSWRFQTTPNANRIIATEVTNVQQADVSEELARRIREVFPDGAVKTVHAPMCPADVADRPELRIAVFDHVDVTVAARDADKPPEAVAAVANFAEVSETRRTFRNAVVSIVADADTVEAMRDRVRFQLAAQRIVGDRERLKRFDEEVRKNLRQLADKARMETHIAICSAYRHLYWPTRSRANDHLRHQELPPRGRVATSASARGGAHSTQTDAIVKALKTNGKIRDEPPGTDRLAAATGFARVKPAVSTEEMAQVPWRDHSQPILLDPAHVNDAISKGISNGTWVYHDPAQGRARAHDQPPRQVRISSDVMLYTPEEAERLGLLRKPVTLAAVRSALKRAGRDSASRRHAADTTSRAGEAEPHATVAEGERGVGARVSLGPALEGAELRSLLGDALGGEPPDEEVLRVLASPPGPRRRWWS